MAAYETVIGLEVHVELATKTKIFCSCTTEFGGEENTHTCPVCTGMPGALPVLNRQVVNYAMAAGIALNCDITRYSKFDRKNYFYPDLPKAYQISQLYAPICQNGFVEIETENGKKKIGIHEIHMEEDAGKLNHDPWEDVTLVDYNRGGTPLIEIVSEPDFRSAEEVIAYLEKLRLTLKYLGVSDCKMQEGSMRADVNLSVRPVGQKEFGTRTEMKNINSLKAIGRAIQYEAKRQIEVIEDGGRVVQETRRWDENKDATFAMRSKENAQDYRYFPDPDLVPIVIDDAWYNNIKDNIPEMAEAKCKRYTEELGLTDYDASVITSSKNLADIFEEAAEVCGKPKEVANWLMGDLLKLVNDNSQDIDEIKLSAHKLADLIGLVSDGVINRNTAKKVFEKVYLEDVDPKQYVEENSLGMISDQNVIKERIAGVLAANEQSVNDYKSGKQKAFGFIVGQTMREFKGKADPAVVNKLLKEMLDS